MILPNQPAHLSNPDTQMGSSPFSSFTPNGGTTPSAQAHHSTTWTPSSGHPPVSTNPSKKRSRDDSTFDSAAADGSYFPAETDNPPSPIKEEPIYGEGMTLLNPNTGISLSADSQTGTWYEEKAEANATKRILPNSSDMQPNLPSSRKSQRLDSLAPMPDDVAQAVLPVSPTKLAAGPPAEPTIDDFTLALGIGWTRIAHEDSALQAAARGWAKYVDNHYSSHIHGAEVLLKSNGLNAYLIGANEGFFLFGEDLSEGRLVGKNWQITLSNLRSNPMVFEGAEVLRAVRTPTTERSGDGNLMGGHFGSAIQNSVNGSWSVRTSNAASKSNGVTEVGSGGMEID